MNKIKTSAILLGTSASLVANRAFAAVTSDTQTGVTDVQNQTNVGATDLNAIIGTVINTLLAVIGVAAVIMLIIGGFRYVFSQGNEKAVSGAKDTILYAIIGIVIAVIAFAVVNFVLANLSKA